MKVEHIAKPRATRSLGAIGVPPKRSVAQQGRRFGGGLVFEGRPLSANALKKNQEMDEYHNSPECAELAVLPKGDGPNWEVPNMSTPENASPTASRRERAALDQLAEQPELFDALSASAQADCMEQVEVLAARLRARFLRR